MKMLTQLKGSLAPRFPTTLGNVDLKSVKLLQLYSATYTCTRQHAARVTAAELADVNVTISTSFADGQPYIKLSKS